MLEILICERIFDVSNLKIIKLTKPRKQIFQLDASFFMAFNKLQHYKVNISVGCMSL